MSKMNEYEGRWKGGFALLGCPIDTALAGDSHIPYIKGKKGSG